MVTPGAAAAGKGTAAAVSAPKVSQGPPKSFSEAFAPLAHHLHPDGLPNHITDTISRRYLNDAWPTRADRSPIPPDVARESIKTLRTFAREDSGLSPAQIFVMTVAACATLPTVGRGTGTSLVDGTSKAYVDIIRCMVPAPTKENNVVDNESQQVEERIPAQVVAMLLSATAASGRCDGRGRAATLRFLTLAVRSGCLRRTTDADRKGSRETLLSLYPVIFGTLTDAGAVGDAVRLLHAITRRKQALPHRARRVRSLYDQASARSRQTPDTSGSNKMGKFSSLLLLLELFARYDPAGCGRYFPSGTRLGSNLTRYFKVPDDEWERDFAGKITSNKALPETLSSKSQPESLALEDLGLKRDTSKIIGQKRRHPDAKNEDELKDQSDEDKMKQIILKYGRSEETNQKSGQKRRKIRFDPTKEYYDTGKSLSATIDRLEDAFDGVHSTSWELLLVRGRPTDGVGLGGSRRGNRAVRASDLLFDKNLRHLILLSSASESATSISARDGKSTSSTPRKTLCNSEVVRLRVCLPHMLHEEYYDDTNASGSEDREAHGDGYSDVDASSDEEDDDRACTGQISGKRRVLRALASLARHTDMLPPEAENFILDEILPSWDGNDKAGLIICNDLVPILAPMGFRDLRRRVLRHLGKLYVCGSPRIKFAVVSGALASLVRRWGRLEWTAQPAKGRGATSGANVLEYKQRSLQELIQWVDNLLLGGLIAEGGSDGSGHELVRLSALDFYASVCDICDQCSFVASPSPALIYRLFLSSTALCVDRVCALLLSYKGIFERMKALSDGEQGREIIGLEKVAIFNCFIWDACSVLWRCSPLPSLDEGQATDMARMNSILFTDIPQETLLALHHLPSDFNVAAALSITHGAVFSGYASDFLNAYSQKKRERSARADDRPEVMSPDLLTGSTKVKYLDYLRDEGFAGLHSFLITFVGSLAEREKKKARKRVEKEMRTSSGTQR